MTKWKRPSGSTIEIGDTPANIEYAETNKWTLVVPKKSDAEVELDKLHKKVEKQEAKDAEDKAKAKLEAEEEAKRLEIERVEKEKSDAIQREEDHKAKVKDEEASGDGEAKNSE